MKEPVKPLRENYPSGKKGDAQFKKAEAQYQKDRVAYYKWLQEQTNRQTQMDLPAIDLPGMGPSSGTRSPSDTEAKSWFKFVGATAKKGTPARKYYDDFTNYLKTAGVPQKYWQQVWEDAITWTQTYGSGSDGKPIKFLDVWQVGNYQDQSQQYGTTKQTQSTVTSYSTSSAAADITSAYKSQLGFEPGAADIAAYRKAVNNAAKGEPATYAGTTTTAPGKGGVISTSTSKGTSSTGFDPTQFAIEYARSNPEYAENFAARTFINLIDQALTDPNRIGQVVQ
jgi:hypothetical protein